MEKEVVTKERPITSELVRGQLRYARRQANFLAMPELGFIPGVDMV